MLFLINRRSPPCPLRRAALPEVRALWQLHGAYQAEQAAAGKRPSKHLLERLGLPPHQWADLQVGAVQCSTVG